jgi:probable phosphoglycerate mutase
MAEQEYRQTRFRRPPGSTELLLVRHGASEPHVSGRSFALVDGHGDPALAPEGRDQALRVAHRLEREHLDALYVTSLRRTHETAAPLADRLGLTPIVEPDLREVFLGEWEGGLFRQKMA